MENIDARRYKQRYMEKARTISKSAGMHSIIVIFFFQYVKMSSPKGIQKLILELAKNIEREKYQH